MVTAIDSSVLLEVLVGKHDSAMRSAESIVAATHFGPVVACDIVIAEVAGQFSGRGLIDFLTRVRVGFEPITFETAKLAGETWRSYRRAGGPRTRLTSDFLIGAHATLQANCLLTRDAGFYRRYFDELSIVEPA